MNPFDASGAFWPVGDGRGELRRLAVRGAGVTVFSRGVSSAAQIVATAVLARLLTPADFGVVTMVTTFSLLVVNFGLIGFTEAVLQRGKIDEALISNLFWINLGAGFLLTVGFAAAGWLLAAFYGDPRVVRVAAGMSLTIFVTSTSVLHLALLKRAMLFAVASANDVLARAVSVAASILLAWAGWGYWALVAGAVALSLTTSVGAWFMCRWIPSLPRRVAGTTSMLQFAINAYGGWSLSYFAHNLDNVLVGWRFGAQPLGLYKKAYDLFALPASQTVAPLTDVAVSALSRLNRDLVQYRRYFLNALSVLGLVGMGLAADFTLVGKDLIRLLLGPRWELAGRIVTFFGPGIGMSIIYSTHYWIHFSIGRADRFFRWTVVELAFTGMLFLLALPWGPIGIAVAWTGSFWILTIPALWYAGRPIHLGVTQVIAAVWKYALASALAGGASSIIIARAPLYFVTASGALGALTRVVATSALFGLLYLGAVILLHGGFQPLDRVAGLGRELLPQSGPAMLPKAITTSAATAQRKA